MKRTEIAEKLSEKGLRVTPQRMAILEAITGMENHPTAENVIEYIKEKHPNISVGTVYKVLESFVEKELLTKVKTESGVMRYDPLLDNHHHRYCADSNRIEDYKDEALDQLISNYFSEKGIENFSIDNIQLHITGRFKQPSKK